CVIELHHDRLSGHQLKPRTKKVGRNDPCPCGSGKKYKKCCLQAEKL
ncbi:SEC-C metal-binding domain-containing protein, partial [uncultured Nitratireductor sp.]